MLKAKRIDTGKYMVTMDGKMYELVLDATKNWRIVVVSKQTAKEKFAKKREAMAYLESKAAKS